METEIDKYFVTEKKLDDLINQGDTYIVFDTNVLLAAYQWRNATKEQIEKIINKFYNENKLKYSMQVIKEFSKNRVFLIRERINDVANEMDMLTNVTPLEKLIPILNGKEIYMKTQEIQKDYIRYINLYRDQLKIIKDELKKLGKEISRPCKETESGFGLANVNERIRMYFGAEFGMKIWSEKGSGTRITIEIPAITDNPEKPEAGKQSTRSEEAENEAEK